MEKYVKKLEFRQGTYYTEHIEEQNSRVCTDGFCAGKESL
jgi:hypothetical protein